MVALRVGEPFARALDGVSEGRCTFIAIEHMFEQMARPAVPHTAAWTVSRPGSSVALALRQAPRPRLRRARAHLANRAVEESAVVRRYEEPIEVRAARQAESAAGEGAAPGPPDAFVWRGRLYVVREVLDHWQERRPWWRDALDGGEPAGQGMQGGRAVRAGGAGRRLRVRRVGLSATRVGCPLPWGRWVRQRLPPSSAAPGSVRCGGSRRARGGRPAPASTTSEPTRPCSSGACCGLRTEAAGDDHHTGRGDGSVHPRADRAVPVEPARASHSRGVAERYLQSRLAAAGGGGAGVGAVRHPQQQVPAASGRCCPQWRLS